MFRLVWTGSSNPTASGWGTKKERLITWPTRPTGIIEERNRIKERTMQLREQNYKKAIARAQTVA